VLRALISAVKVLRCSMAHHIQHSPLQHSPLQHAPLQHAPLQHAPLQHSPRSMLCESTVMSEKYKKYTLPSASALRMKSLL
jgi:hypothetical protein